MPAHAANLPASASRPRRGSFGSPFRKLVTMLQILEQAFVEAQAMRRAAYRRYPFMDW